ncbi:MAG: hypothetical protein R2827_04160 [Bdellovibrionales bacterium]
MSLSKSFLNNTVGEPLIVGVIFTLFGAAGLYFVAWLKGRVADIERLQESFPDQPWLWRTDWSKAKGEGNTLLLKSIVSTVSVVLIAVCVPVLSQHGKSVFELRMPESLVLVLPFFAVLFSAWSVILWGRQFKYGKPICRLNTLPGRIGGKFQAEVHIEYKFIQRQSAEVKLTCVNVFTSGSGKNRSTHRNIFMGQ